MCGLAGYFNVDRDKVNLFRMLSMIMHRGQDGNGQHVEDRFGLAHARLAIIDIEGGAQPMFNEDRTVILCGNHEIYNFSELRRDLEAKGHRFSTRSDTEVIVHAYEEWGLDSFGRLRGMFAVAIVDKNKNRCVLARDHIGIKQLVYGAYRGGWVFASEAKPILALDGFQRKINPDAFHLFMNFRYVPTDDTLFAGIQKLPPGNYAVIDENGNMMLHEYYSVFKRNHTRRWSDIREAETALTESFDQSVSRHLIADVPVGLYLSGGIDSSLVAAFAAAKQHGIQSFCMAFGEPSDENRDAETVAQHVGCTHQNLSVGDAPLSLMPEVIWHTEEPKVNCIQGYLLAREVRKHVKVALSGMGGDELFAGYTNNDILYPMTLFSRLCRLPPCGAGYRIVSGLRAIVANPALDHFWRMADLAFSAGDPVMFYTILRNAFDHSPGLMKDIYGKFQQDRRFQSCRALLPLFKSDGKDILGALMLMEMRTKMVNDFLQMDDRVSMAHGLEVRVPFLDRDFMETALSIPTAWKYYRFNKKKILKDIAKSRLPEMLLNKKKWGFSFNPYYQFTKDLKKTAEQELTRERVGDMGLFNYDWIRTVLDHPPTPRMRWHYFNLWVMVGFSIWHRMFVENLVNRRPVIS